MSFNGKGDSLAIADSNGDLRLTDVHTHQVIAQAKAHQQRIGSLHWGHNYLVSGSRDSMVNLYDVRRGLKHPVHCFAGHRQEICGLKLSPDDRFVASGGNDNQCILWSMRMMKVIETYGINTSYQISLVFNFCYKKKIKKN
jgi:cell division cycle 20-like protein 1 (cofactor of APC complex)